MKTQKKSQGFKQNPRKPLDQNLTPKKSHAEFLSHKSFQTAWYDTKNTNISNGMFVKFIRPSGVRTFSLSGGHCNNTRDTQEHIKTVAKQVWFYFIRWPMQPGYAGTITNLQIVLTIQIKLPQKILAKIFLPIKIRKSKISNSKNPLIILVTWNPENPPGVPHLHVSMPFVSYGIIINFMVCLSTFLLMTSSFVT